MEDVPATFDHWRLFNHNVGLPNVMERWFRFTPWTIVRGTINHSYWSCINWTLSFGGPTFHEFSSAIQVEFAGWAGSHDWLASGEPRVLPGNLWEFLMLCHGLKKKIPPAIHWLHWIFSSGWWFGYFFSYLGNGIVTPTDELANHHFSEG